MVAHLERPSQRSCGAKCCLEEQEAQVWVLPSDCPEGLLRDAPNPGWAPDRPHLCPHPLPQKQIMKAHHCPWPCSPLHVSLVLDADLGATKYSQQQF